MCGLVGIYKPLKINANLFINGGWEKAKSSISHRGTTGLESWEKDLCIYYRRLPINGTQGCPFDINGNKGWIIGEYYDWDPTKYLNDIAQLIAEFDPHRVLAFPGMYHGVISTKKGTYLITDRYGKKPLYYRKDIHAFASEIKALTALAPVTIDKRYFNYVSYLIIPPTLTPYKEIEQLSPGTMVNLETGLKAGFLSPHYFYRPLKESFKNAVKKRLNTQSKFSLLCSGGLDSSILYKQLTELTDEPFPVFHIDNGKDSTYFDMLNVPEDRVYRISLSPDDDSINYIICKYGELPVDLGSMYPQYLLGEAIQKQFNGEYPIVFTGDGADEVFAGYKRAQVKDTRNYDVRIELPYYHLPRLDKMSMAYTLELRSPFLDEEVIRYGLNLSYEEVKGKKPLKELAKELGVPQPIIDRKKEPLRADYLRADKFKFNQQLQQYFLKHFKRGLHI